MLTDSEKEALADKVARMKRESPHLKVSALARKVIRGYGITYPSDVERLAGDLCSRLGKRGARAKSARRRNNIPPRPRVPEQLELKI